MTSSPVAIVLAAGKGVRTGSERPKQLLALGGVPVMAYAIDQHLRLGHHVIVVVSADVRAEAEALVDGRAVELVQGGPTRRESVLSGIAALPPDTSGATAVILRNAASPNTPDAVIEACVAGIDAHDGMQAYVASEATTFVHDGQRLQALVPRADTGFTCDPTVYRRSLIDSIAAEMSAGTDGETPVHISKARAP